MSLLFHEPDESLERSLFERRARAGGVREDLPSLDAVLRAAEARPRESSGGRGRTLGGLALAAACVLAVMKAHPHESTPDRIVADVGEEAPASVEARGGVCEVREVRACSADSASAGLASIAQPAPAPGPACVAPLATFATFGSLVCDSNEAVRSELR